LYEYLSSGFVQDGMVAYQSKIEYQKIESYLNIKSQLFARVLEIIVSGYREKKSIVGLNLLLSCLEHREWVKQVFQRLEAY
jgi:hypothetical protein